MLKAFLLIVVGLAGDPEHGKTFHKWGTTLAQASGKLGVAPENVAYLVDAPAEGPWRLDTEHRDYLYTDQKLSAPASGVEVVLNRSPCQCPELVRAEHAGLRLPAEHLSTDCTKDAPAGELTISAANGPVCSGQVRV